MNTPLEPVGAEDLTALRELEGARINLALRLLDVEQERVRILAAERRVKTELNVIFRRIATERGLGDHALVEINSKTGEVALAVDEPERSTNGASEEVAAAPPPA